MTVEKFVAATNLPKEKYMITFQSRLGRDPWLQPYTDKSLELLAEQGAKRVKVMARHSPPTASKRWKKLPSKAAKVSWKQVVLSLSKLA